jgi:hypothetical protein
MIPSPDIPQRATIHEDKESQRVYLQEIKGGPYTYAFFDNDYDNSLTIMETKMEFPEGVTEEQKYLLAHWAVHSYEFAINQKNYVALLDAAREMQLQSLTRDVGLWMMAQCELGVGSFGFFVDAFDYNLTAVAEFYEPQIKKELPAFFRSKYFPSLMKTPKGALAAQGLVVVKE